MMQLATLDGDQPWACTVYFVPDANLNLYWISLPSRRHSQEIERHPKVAAAIPIKHVVGESVIGLSVEGEAEVVTDAGELKQAAELYAARYGKDIARFRDENKFVEEV